MPEVLLTVVYPDDTKRRLFFNSKDIPDLQSFKDKLSSYSEDPSEEFYLKYGYKDDIYPLESDEEYLALMYTARINQVEVLYIVRKDDDALKKLVELIVLNELMKVSGKECNCYKCRFKRFVENLTIDLEDDEKEEVPVEPEEEENEKKVPLNNGSNNINQGGLVMFANETPLLTSEFPFVIPPRRNMREFVAFLEALLIAREDINEDEGGKLPVESEKDKEEKKDPSNTISNNINQNGVLIEDDDVHESSDSDEEEDDNVPELSDSDEEEDELPGLLSEDDLPDLVEEAEILQFNKNEESFDESNEKYRELVNKLGDDYTIRSISIFDKNGEIVEISSN